jgi:nitronate monooxygenase
MPNAIPDLRDLGRLPVVAAPLAGGASTVALVAAAAQAGAIGLLAAGYKTAEALRADIEATRGATPVAFGVNLFVPGEPSGDQPAVARYVEGLRSVAADLGAEVGAPSWDDDAWDAKLEVVDEMRPAVVSFTFGCPSPEIISRLKASGIHVCVTVTSPEEALIAAAAGGSSLCVQGPEAGGHRGTFANVLTREPGLLDLLSQVRRATDLPLIAAGGLGRPEDIAAVLRAGAVMAQVGTALLRSPEAGTAGPHRAALADPSSPETVVTRAFSGRPACGIRNRFIADHPDAPAAYPEVNNATRALRAAAAKQGRPDALHLWAGTGYKHAREAPAGEILTWLSSSTPDTHGR